MARYAPHDATRILPLVSCPSPLFICDENVLLHSNSIFYDEQVRFSICDTNFVVKLFNFVVETLNLGAFDSINFDYFF